VSKRLKIPVKLAAWWPHRASVLYIFKRRCEINTHVTTSQNFYDSNNRSVSFLVHCKQMVVSVETVYTLQGTWPCSSWMDLRQICSKVDLVYMMTKNNQFCLFSLILGVTVYTCRLMTRYWVLWLVLLTAGLPCHLPSQHQQRQQQQSAKLIRQVEVTIDYLLNIWEFVYFVCGLSPPKHRVVRRQNLARRRVPTMCRICVGFYVYRGSSLRK